MSRPFFCRCALRALLMSAAASPCAWADAPATSPAATMPDSTPATRPASLFDARRHMHVADVRPGMKGYGLTVFSGSTIERFDVEVISILRDSFGPQQDVVMIRCLDKRMEHYGPIAGCSGSPIYLYDADGVAKLIGAYAYGFDFARDPIVGVQPIEYMLTLTRPPPHADDTGTQPTSAPPTMGQPMSGQSMSWSLIDANVIPALTKARQARPLARRDAMSLRPLSVPLAVGGLSGPTLDTLRPMFEAYGFEPMLSPAGAATTEAGDANADPKIEPGSVLGAAVLSGDLELTALGTCTEVVDGRAFAFGHPFNGEGATSIPMGAGTVSLVMPTLTNSFKMGGITRASGAIDNDGTYGIAGQVGATAATIPIAVDVTQPDGATRTFNYRAAVHRTFSPMMVGTALQSSVTAQGQLPVEYTIHYSVTMRFAGGRGLTIANVVTSLEGFDVARDAAWPVSTMMSNPFGNVPLEEVRASVRVERGVRNAEIESATAASTSYRPGETARVHVRFKRHKAGPFMQTVELPLPRTLPDGDYTINVSDATTNMQALAQAEPNRFAMRDVNELFATVSALGTGVRGDALYVRLGGLRPGVAIGRTALRRLPPSLQNVLQAAARPDSAATGESLTRVVPMDGVVVSGSAEAAIHVARKLP